MERGMIEQVRRFNRTVTQRVGALDEAFLSLDRPLGPARLLWEIGPGGSDVRSLRTRLDLDAGYLSRLLRSLESDGLVTVRPSEADGRVRTAYLTAAGRAEREVLDRRSDERAASILRPLAAGQRDRLVAAMAEVERLLVASTVEIADCDPRHPHARQSFQAYADELSRRFTGGYDPALAISASADELTPPAGLLLVATLRGEAVGCCALKFRGGTAHLKRMWISPAVRGLGLGRRLLAAAEGRAAAHGSRVVQLDTNAALGEAIALYRSAGYREVPAFNDEFYADHWFSKEL